MRKIVIAAAALVVVVFILAVLLTQQNQKSASEPEQTPLTAEQGKWEDLATGETFQVLLDGNIVEMDVNEYLWGVVAAEMPASFELEALKAQAIAARTYALRKAGAGSANHPLAQICGDHTCCQAYISPADAAGNWGANAENYTRKITAAIVETNDLVILYDGALIDAVFHSSSGEKTQNAVEVWGGSVPYLVSVESPEGEDVPNYHSSVSVDLQSFQDKLLKDYPEAVFGENPETWLGAVTRTDSGSVSEIVIGGVPVTGRQVRSLYGLRSANFTMSVEGDAVVFDVIGFGHGVGMSQYGANSMAKSGSTCEEILKWYYTGVEISAKPS